MVYMSIPKNPETGTTVKAARARYRIALQLFPESVDCANASPCSTKSAALYAASPTTVTW